MNLEIANRLQQLRKEKGFSQEQLANELGISRQAVSKWERAESSPDTDNLICLARLYGVSLDELLSTDESTEDIINNKVEDNKENETFNVIQVPELPKVSIEEYCEYPVKVKDKTVKVLRRIQAIIPLLTVAVYLVLGAVFSLWHPGWIVFVLMPALITLCDCFICKKVTAFAYPCFVAALYLFLGFVFDLWHPGWIVFISIPIFYVLGEKI